MQAGGFLENEYGRQDGNSFAKVRERGGLVPITAKILADSVINQEEVIAYQGSVLSDVSIVRLS